MTSNKSCVPEEIKSLVPDLIDLSDKELVKELILKLLNVIEELVHENKQLKEKFQLLSDQINISKGEKPRPTFKPNVPNKENNPPKQPDRKEWKKESKNDKIKIDRTETIKVDKSTLPADAIHKGYREVITQNIILQTDNIRWFLERFYSPSENKFYEAALPDGLKGSQFAPELKSFINFLYFKGRVTEPILHGLLHDIGINISEGQISNILTREHADIFTQEKQEVFEAGMEHTKHFNIDSTGARHNGENWFNHVVCSLLFTNFFIRKGKSRETIEAFLNLSRTDWIKKIMVSDNAKEFWTLTEIQALCWVHETRHYRKLNPILDHHKDILKDFISEIWAYYYTLLEYKKCPEKWNKEFLRGWFDKIFSRETGYLELDKRIASTKQNKEKLLVVIDYPYIPLHNNCAELAVREPVIKGGISYGTRSEEGRIALENMLSLSDTCRKLGVSFYAYLNDRISGKNQISSLAQIIEEKTAQCS